MDTLEELGVDERFLRGEIDDLPAFEAIRPILHVEPGVFPWHDLGDAGTRLIQFAHRFGSFDWSHDPDHEKVSALLATAGAGTPDKPLLEPFDSLWRTLFATVRADRFGEGTVASHSVALVRIANELRSRLRLERAGGESHPPDGSVEPYVAERIRKAPPADCGLLLGSTPVIAFGDPATTRCASLGLNPSRVEFMVEGQLLSGSARRLATFESLGVNSLANASVETVARVLGACRRYFWRHPYRRWFNQLEEVLTRAGYSYYDGTACHLDLAQWATDPTWAKLHKSQQKRLLDDGIPFLADQLEHSTLDTILINGAYASRWAAATLGVKLDLVSGKSEAGTTKFSVGTLKGKIQVIAWSTNLQSSWGVTGVVRSAIGERVAELVQGGK
jgi:hypothetical protein